MIRLNWTTPITGTHPRTKPEVDQMLRCGY